MSGSGGDTPALVLRLSVPARGGLRLVAGEMATRVAAYLGSQVADAQSAAATVERLAAHVAPPDADAEITFEFRELDRELLILARCNGRSQEVRYPLPA